MSRSNPEILQNPSARWHEWDGEHGNVRYYDKEQETNINVELPFRFLVLDVLGTVKGWHNESESGIYSNEVKRIDRHPLTVKAFEGGVLAEGLYKNIKNTIKAEGGKFYSSVYIAFKDEGELCIGNISLKGAALSAWMDFTRKIGKNLYEKAIVIDGFDEGQKGSITYRVPTFKIVDVTEETNEKAIELDKVLQEYFDKKLSSTEEVIDDVNGTPPPSEGEQPPHPAEQPASIGGNLYDDVDDIDDDLPF